MSQYYMAGDVSLWNPPTGVSRLFLGQVRLFEAELALVSGFGPLESDECEVNLPALNGFAKALAADRRLRQHQVWRALADGFVVTVLAIAVRANLLDSWPPPSDAVEADLRERGRVMGHSLPT